MKSGNATFDQMRFPMNADLWEERPGGLSVIAFDQETTKQKLHDFLFDDIKPE